MIERYRSVPEFLAKRALATVTGNSRKGGVGVISGSRGPTTFFVALPRKRHCDREEGCLLVTPNAGAVRRAAGVSFALTLIVAALSAALYHASKSERKR